MSALRVFIAIPIKKELQEKILLFSKNFTPQNFLIRWLSGKNLHITLIPPWYENNIENIKQKLDLIAAEIQPFNLSFKKICFGPNQKEPRLIWAEGDTPQEIVDLKSVLERSLNFRPERRQFLLHLTLARFRPENFKNFSQKELNEKISWEEKVDSIVLMQSHLLPTGAEYEILHEIRLKL